MTVNEIVSEESSPIRGLESAAAFELVLVGRCFDWGSVYVSDYHRYLRVGGGVGCDWVVWKRSGRRPFRCWMYGDVSQKGMWALLCPS